MKKRPGLANFFIKDRVHVHKKHLGNSDNIMSLLYRCLLGNVD